MKKIKLMKTVLLLCAVFAFSNCEEDGEIQFIVVDDFETNAKVTGLQTTTSFTTSSSTDISDLLDNASTFVEAKIEKVTLTLQDDYSGSSVSGTFQIKVGPIDISKTLTLNKGTGVEVTIPENASDILSLISSGAFPYVFNGDLSSPAGDNDFTINLKFKVKATVE